MTLSTTDCARVVSPPRTGTPGSFSPAYSSSTSSTSRLARQPERDDQRERLRTAGGEIAEIDRRGAKPEVAPREQVEAEVHALDERVLRHDEPVDLRRVVLDALREPAPLELGEEAELAGLVEPHSSSIRTRPSSVSGSSA